MMNDLPGVLAEVAAHIGLPGSDFDSDRPVQHSTGHCPTLGRDEDPDFFGEGGRYDKMFEEEDRFREWYRPHNEVCLALLDRSKRGASVALSPACLLRVKRTACGENHAGHPVSSPLVPLGFRFSSSTPPPREKLRGRRG
ncbi:unnamed protein product [Ectocarpus sp. CCAP 1310/34]|nr:unnamed protein product [Ectocarpus sp. CCAP 1310/34]